MDIETLIEAIESDMGCANDCPMKDTGHYVIDECRCYKREAIELVNKLDKALTASTSALRSYQYGNTEAGLAESVADHNDSVLGGGNTETAEETVEALGNMPPKKFWVSILSESPDYRPIHYPPDERILGWWCSGYTQITEEEEAATLCIAVKAKNEADVLDAVLTEWPEFGEDPEWRFYIERPDDWMPNDRFPLSDWMKERAW